MEDNKIDELKNAMGSANLSQEQLQEQLKQKIQKASKTRALFEKGSAKRATLNSFKHIKKSENNKILLVLLSITAILIFIAIYIFNKETKKEEPVYTKETKNRLSFKELYDSKNYATYNCYEFKSGKISFPIKECKEEMDKFLLDNRNANRFEIVPLISENDSIIYKSIENDIKNQEEALNKKVKEYLFIGLATERILESVWYIKKILGEDTIVTSSQYYVKSENENEQGVIIRAYH
ncbi:hypothetical protein [Halarcobacter ebronensis]|uniref:Uncharacterized protein n=1 Tax=Halarcobacter ebronensis TaxID=1462615 RepID=A0A4Q1AHJ4_9BACT|nr:hypothetical protein [Halarcobacter ebronensis]QKF81210.1 hypothetical protein AEBR_0710 [Halarcobacter ebronensis]RXK03216.1 hypothetical protein CRV07_12520 [Halarcobacter ebronensis]